MIGQLCEPCIKVIITWLRKITGQDEKKQGAADQLMEVVQEEVADEGFVFRGWVEGVGISLAVYEHPGQCIMGKPAFHQPVGIADFFDLEILSFAGSKPFLLPIALDQNGLFCRSAIDELDLRMDDDVDASLAVMIACDPLGLS